jgi:hypothetical protein
MQHMGRCAMMARPADVSTSGRTVPAAAAGTLCPLRVTQDIQSQADVRAAGGAPSSPLDGGLLQSSRNAP